MSAQPHTGEKGVNGRSAKEGLCISAVVEEQAGVGDVDAHGQRHRQQALSHGDALVADANVHATQDEDPQNQHHLIRPIPPADSKWPSQQWLQFTHMS